MASYLLDTNHLGAALNPASPVRERFRQAIHSGHKLATCVPVLCELEAGIAQTARADENRQALKRMLSQVRLWPLEVPVATAYGVLYQELRKQGAALSQVDMMLAAMAAR